MEKRFIYVLFLFISLFVSSCALTVKPAATKSAKAYYESFFVGEFGTQYFIKPIEFNAENGNENLFVDFTFRYKNELKDSTIINFSIEGEDVIRSVSEIIFTNAVSSVLVKNISLLFNEKKDKKLISRFSAKCSTQEMVDIFDDPGVSVTINTNNSSNPFLSSKKSQKTIRSLRDNLYILFR